MSTAEAIKDLYAKITEATAPKEPEAAEVPSSQPEASTQEDTQATEPQASPVHLEDTFKKLEAKDKEVREQRKALAEQAKQLEDLKTKAELYERIEALKSQDPLGLIQELGFDLESISKAAELRKSKDPDVIKALQRVEAMERQLEAARQETERNRRAEERKQLKAIIETRAQEAEYDIITTLGLQDEVLTVMESIYQETKGPLTMDHLDKACKTVCDEIVGKFEKVKSTKYLSKLDKQLQSATENAKTPEPEDEPVKKSLSNKMSVTTKHPSSSQKPINERLKDGAALIAKIHKSKAA